MNTNPTPATPRTDAEEKELIGQLGWTLVGAVPADFARQLERDLATATAAIYARDAELARLRAALDDDVLAEYAGKDGRRDWWTGGVRLYPGDKVIVVGKDAPPEVNITSLLRTGPGPADGTVLATMSLPQ